jgi:A/G-specific adenine glycosylase
MTDQVGVAAAKVGGAEDCSVASERLVIQRRLLRWFAQEGRRLPWRVQTDPFAILVSEILLQRTRTDVVELHYEQFMRAYPTPAALASADVATVSQILKPLGFRHRTERLPSLAAALMVDHSGAVPRSKEALLRLPGVGEYVANAVLAIAFGRQAPLLDPNVIRVLDRCLGWHSRRLRPRVDRALWGRLASLIPRRRAREFGLALVDLGAMVCRPRHPRCDICPLRELCIHHRRSLSDTGKSSSN